MDAAQTAAARERSMTAAVRERSMAEARRDYRSGRVDQAARAWRGLFDADPGDADALHLLGVATDALGDPAGGAALIGRALAIRETASFRCNLGLVLGRLGRHAEAVVELERALALRPGYPDALNNLGVSLDALRRWPEAEQAYRQAIAARTGYGDAWSNLGHVLRAQGRTGDATHAYKQALACHAAVPNPAAPANLGQVLHQLGRFDEAVAACEQALALRPDMPGALTTLGHALRDLGRLPEAEAALRRALRLRPGEASAHNNLAITLQAMGRDHEALALLDLAAALDPGDPEIRHHRAMLLLRAGRFAEGWAEYEWRLRIRQAGDSYRQFENRAAWRGELLDGRSVLLVPEQGLGDTIQFARYAALVQARGGRVVLGVQAPLRRLFATLPGVDRLVAVGEPLPPTSLHCPLLSLPGVLGTTLDTIPAPSSYLQAEPEAVARWAARLRTGEPGLRVGLVWAGNPNHVGDRRRSLPFAGLAPLLGLAGVRLFSLQVGPRAADIAGQPAVEDLASGLTDFAETAAVVANLDLVIAADTSTAHLAGALGRPVWLLLPRPADWRWLREGGTNPWYPSMRLFRQDGDGTWPPVVARVAAELAFLAARPASRPRSDPAERLILFQWGVSPAFGWGVYGLNLLLAWAGRPGFRPASLQPIDPAQLGLDPLEQAAIAPALARSAAVLDGLRALPGRQVTSGHLVLHAINNGMVRGRAAHGVDVLGTPQVGVAFLDTAEAAPGARERLGAYEMIVAGSTWNRRLLREAGAPRVELVLQGVDPSHFHPAPGRGLFPGRFVVFSGGKLEYRKGGDLVVLAFRRFAARHPDALLLTAWSSPWPGDAGAFSRNPAIAPPVADASGRIDVDAWTAANGIPAHQVRHLPALPNRAMPRVMREAHAALFPNRAEGGTNLVAMECMACAVPTILSANTGHLDLIAPGRTVSLARQSPIPGAWHRDWGESDVEEIVEALEGAYRDRDAATRQGQLGAEFMAGLGWGAQMRRLGDLVQPFVG